MPNTYKNISNMLDLDLLCLCFIEKSKVCSILRKSERGINVVKETFENKIISIQATLENQNGSQIVNRIFVPKKNTNSYEDKA